MAAAVEVWFAQCSFLLLRRNSCASAYNSAHDSSKSSHVRTGKPQSQGVRRRRWLFFLFLFYFFTSSFLTDLGRKLRFLKNCKRLFCTNRAARRRLSHCLLWFSVLEPPNITQACRGTSPHRPWMQKKIGGRTDELAQGTRQRGKIKGKEKRCLKSARERQHQL